MSRLVLAFALAGCYSPQIADGQYSCVSDGVCPDGLVCTNQCFRCVHPGQPLDDADHCPSADFAHVQDAASGADLRCASAHCAEGCASMGGARAPIDPGLQNVALCLGQWDVPGLFGTVHSAACDLATGQNCSAVDNCAAGWHVCTDLDLMMKGFTPPLCSSIASGMWVTAVRGDMNFNCSVMGDDNLFGCGAGGALPGLCLVVDKVWRAADCGGPWSCGDPAHEASYVTKSDLTGGGLICCHD